MGLTRRYLLPAVGIALILVGAWWYWHIRFRDEPVVVAPSIHPQPVWERAGEYRCNAVAFSPDGRLIAVGGSGYREDGHGRKVPGGIPELSLHDAATGKRVSSLKGHRSAVLSVAFSPVGDLLASCGCDCQVMLWDVKTGKVLPEMRQTDAADSVAISPYGELLAAATSRELRVMDVPSGELRWSRREVSTGNIPDIGFSTDGRMLAGTTTVTSPRRGSQHTITFRDPISGKVLRELTGRSTVHGTVFSPDGTMVLVGGNGLELRSLPELRVQRRIDWLKDLFPNEDVNPDGIFPVSFDSTAFSPDGSILAILLTSNRFVPAPT